MRKALSELNNGTDRWYWIVRPILGLFCAPITHHNGASLSGFFVMQGFCPCDCVGPFIAYPMA